MVLKRVRRDKPMNLGFEGKPYSPGAVVPISEFGERPVVIENAGPDKPGHGHNRQPNRWILWAWDSLRSEWMQLAACYAISWEWAEVLKEPAIRALAPIRPELYDVLERGRGLAGELLSAIDDRLEPEEKAVQLNVWAAIYQEAPGRIVNLEV